MSTNRIGVKIKSTRKTNAGDLLLTVERGADVVGNLKRVSGVDIKT